MEIKVLEKELSYRVQGCVYEVYKELGSGFMEKVYEKALLKEFELQGIKAKNQVPSKVHYKGDLVGEYFADIIVEGKLILELKAQGELSKVYEAQLLNYLKATGIKLGMLINFHYPKATIKRLVL